MLSNNGSGLVHGIQPRQVWGADDNSKSKKKSTHFSIHFSNVYALRSSTKGNVFVPRPNSNFMKQTFHYSGTILWNSLPPNLKLIQNIYRLCNVKTK